MRGRESVKGERHYPKVRESPPPPRSVAALASRVEDMSVDIDTGLVRSARHLPGANDPATLEGFRQATLRGERFWARARFALDLALLCGAAVLADLVSPHVTTFAGQVLWPALFAAIVLCFSYLRGSYARRVTLDSLDDLRATGAVVAVATSVVVTLRVIAESSPKTAADQTL